LFYSVFASVLSWFGVELPAKFTGFGSMIINGLIAGLKAGFEKLKGVWATINSYMPDFMRAKMDIHSPSRVMAGLGGHIMSGLGVGLTQAFPTLKNQYSQVLSLFTDKTQSPALEQINTAAPVLSKIQTNTPNLAASRQSSVAIAGDTYTINLTFEGAGHAVKDIESKIEQVIQRIQTRKMARIRASMFDQE
jgi:hypothetical protein